ncbi:MAG: helix-turn-helix transcriptional regulator [Opitutaceae bacterium]|nr:helix-turn-helix transcriptional regulator [Opitutaceae bacterium]
MGNSKRSSGKSGKCAKSTKPELSAADGRLLKAAERAIFAKNIKAVRQAQGISVSEMSRRLDADRGYLRDIEAGTVNVSIDRMASFAAVLGVQLHELLQPSITLGSKSTRDEDSQIITRLKDETPAKGRRRQKEK